MTKRLVGAALALALGAGIAVLGGATGGCSSATTQCDCADPAITVSIPSDIAPSALPLKVTGAACTGAEPTCVNQTGGCSEYRVLASGAGVCELEVDFATGRVFQATVTVTASSDACCTGFYPSPASAGQIVVPSPDGGS